MGNRTAWLHFCISPAVNRLKRWRALALVDPECPIVIAGVQLAQEKYEEAVLAWKEARALAIFHDTAKKPKTYAKAHER